MSHPGAEDVTALLERWNSGDRGALESLLPIVYAELHKLASSQWRRELPGSTLQPTALVHETYLRLLNQRRVQFNNRSHFFGAAARIIRRILVDHARERTAQKRGGGETIALTWESAVVIDVPDDLDLMDLDRSLSDLEAFDPRKAKVVELRYFAGLSIPQTAEVMEMSPTSIKREWAVARAWLYERLTGRLMSEDSQPEMP